MNFTVLNLFECIHYARFIAKYIAQKDKQSKILRTENGATKYVQTCVTECSKFIVQICIYAWDKIKL